MNHRMVVSDASLEFVEVQIDIVEDDALQGRTGLELHRKLHCIL